MDKPLYQSVIDTVIDRIASGEWGPGALLPSETQLGEDIGVSQGTARKALAELEARGVIVREQGRGSFVAINTPERALFNFFRLRRTDGSIVQPVLEQEEVIKRQATPDETEALYGEPTEVFEIRRLRSLDGRLAARETCIVSTKTFPGLIDRAPLPNTLYVLYQQAYNCVVIKADEKLSAHNATLEEAAMLNILPGTALIHVQRRARDLLGRYVELRASSYLCDGFEYAVELD